MSVARRQIVEEPINHDRWLISYADFITLLFAFFVVMYSISQVNQGKYKVLSETLAEVFNGTEQGSVAGSNLVRAIDPFQLGEIARSSPRHVVALEATGADQDEGKSAIEANTVSDPATEKTHEIAAEFNQITRQIEGAFGDLLRDKLLTVRGNEEWLELTLQSSLLFESAGAQLNNNALELLAGIIDVLKGQSNPIRVEGFTDNIPIRSSTYPSNWELSTARAAAVVQLFVEEGMEPQRFAVVGYGEFQPVDDNTTPAGRAANRRVVLMISKTGELRPTLSVATTAAQLVVEQPVEQPVSPFRINIPGISAPVEPIPAVVVDVDPLQGVETIELEGGGLLFTSGPE
ncbi:MAG: chemotaxis protein MotB [Paraglaciecola psychrophila]|jgi:chemotaxis protein MotB